MACAPSFRQSPGLPNGLRHSAPRKGKAGFTSIEAALHHLDVETFDDVALAHVLISLEGHAALLTGLHFLHFVLEALQGGELALVDHDIVADEADMRTAAHDT